MPKGKKSVKKKVDTLACPFCQARMLPEDLADHITAIHSTNSRAESLPVQSHTVSDTRTIEDIREQRGIGGPPMLRGQDVPAHLSQITIKIKELREAPPDFGSPFIIDLDGPLPVPGRESFAVNITNLRALTTLCGLDPKKASIGQIIAAARGKSLTLLIAMTNNPKEHKMVRSLFFQA
jgi:hypothetical protein